MLLSEMIEILSDRNLKQVARKIGINHNTLCNIVNGKVSNPSYKTFELLRSYIEGTGDGKKQK